MNTKSSWKDNRMRKAKKHWTETHREMLDACIPGLTWAKNFPTFAQAWKACDNARWMTWYLEGKKKQSRHLTDLYTRFFPQVHLFDYPDFIRYHFPNGKYEKRKHLLPPSMRRKPIFV